MAESGDVSIEINATNLTLERKIYPAIFDSIHVGDHYGTACARLGVNLDSKKWVYLAFCRQETRNTLLQASIISSRDIPTGFDSPISEARLKSALIWALDLDAMAKQKYLDGAIIYVQVPNQRPKVLPSLFRTLNAEEYWKLRLSSGMLIRPLLLENPSTDRLFPFQQEGVDWLLETSAAILADDMGLGKTIQAITALRILFNRGCVRSALVLCPKSLLANWETEFEKWAPELSHIRLNPRASEREEVWSTLVNRVHVILVNYEQMRKPTKQLVSKGIDVIIADEAHKIRNLGSSVTQGVRRILHKRFWALTGTPIERDQDDLATLLSTIAPHRFAVSDGKQEASVLRGWAKPYILRRDKDTVLNQLPKVLESTEVIELLPEQWRSYRNAIQLSFKEFNTNAVVISLINRLRAICDYDPFSGKSSKLDRIVEIAEDIAKVGEKAVIFSYLLKPLYMLHNRLGTILGNHSIVLLEGKTQVNLRDQVLKEFKSDPNITGLLASSRVAGEGLTLTEANHVIFLNEWWNPSANAQARDRIVRIGQKRGVHVYKFICKGTVEETLQKILEVKGETFRQIIDRLARPISMGGDTQVIELLQDLRSDIEENIWYYR